QLEDLIRHAGDRPGDGLAVQGDLGGVGHSGEERYIDTDRRDPTRGGASAATDRAGFEPAIGY
ncbi:MAG: hypothetical protein ACO32Z_07815, partial [Gemmatimonadaceae bacterium]